MKVSTIQVANIIRQIATFPQHELTSELIATKFADVLETSYTGFNRTKFLADTGVSARMAQEAEDVQMPMAAANEDRGY